MIKVPPSLANKITIHVENMHIHILELTDKSLTGPQIQALIKKIAKDSNLLLAEWNWIYYGNQGKAFAVSTGIYTPLLKNDPRLYKPFKNKMHLAPQFREL